MGRLVAVGDIHGCAETFRLLLDRLSLCVGDTLLTIGDLSSKGFDSRGVHQELIDLEDRGINVVALIGNHEVMLLGLQRFIGADVDLSRFSDAIFHEAEISFMLRRNGGWATLKSYGFEHADTQRFWAFDKDDPRIHFDKIAGELSQLNWHLPQDHLDFLCRCQLHHLERNCLFVHAGMHPEMLSLSDARSAVARQLKENPKDLCWNREWLGQRPGFRELLVHGHTPLPYLYLQFESTDPWKDDDLVFQSVVHQGALNLDSGAFLETGHLTAVDIPEDGEPQQLQFVRVPRVDPVEKDRLWYVNHLT